MRFEATYSHSMVNVLVQLGLGFPDALQEYNIIGFKRN